MLNSGIFSLRTPRDLLDKARHDLERLRKQPTSAYAAFDFFVAIRHIPDWIYPEEAQKTDRDALFNSNVELRIARHIADSGKHFKVTAKQHKQVVSTTSKPSVFDAGVFDKGVFDVGTLIVELDALDPDTAHFGNQITALDLAERIFAAVACLVP